MRKSIFTVAVFCLCILTGCTTRMIVKEGNLEEKKIDLLVRPSQSLGIQVTDAIRAGKTTLLKIEFPGKFRSENYPGRIRWNAWLIDHKGKEHFAQVVRGGMYTDGRLYAYAIIDGEVDEVGLGKMVILSSKLDYVSDLAGNVHAIGGEEFQNKSQYRLDVIKSFGSRINYCEVIEDKSIAAIKSYNTYKVKEYQEITLLTPYRYADFIAIHKLNPSYGLMERIISDGDIVISTNPVYTVASIGISVIKGMNASTKGWDYLSELPSREMLGAISEYDRLFYLRLIEILNEKIEIRDREIEKYKKAAKVVPEKPVVVVQVQEKETKKPIKKSRKGERR